MQKRPIIGVTGPNRGGTPAWLMTRLALRRAGARPVRITPRQPRSSMHLDGLVVGGGSDIEPSHYGETPFEELKDTRRRGSRIRDLLVSVLLFFLRILFAVKFRQGYDPRRDELEKKLLAEALEKGIPVLGICRGAQLLNVVLGGTLHQDISEFYDEEPHVRTLLPRKRIRITPDSRLHDIVRTTHADVNALHDQAIADLGEQVAIVARDRARVVQAIEYDGAPFVIGVQWHPEYLPQIPEQQRLFQKMVEAAASQTESAVAH